MTSITRTRTQKRGSPGNRTLNLRIKSPIPGYFRRLSTSFEIMHCPSSAAGFQLQHLLVSFVVLCRARVEIVSRPTSAVMGAQPMG